MSPPEARLGAPRERRAVTVALGLAYVLLAALYAWQASKRPSPTIFVDEVELGEISRSIAETGSAARRGEPWGFQTLYAYLLAPAWWIDDTERAWDVVKLIGTFAMTTALFPAYALARYVVSRPWAVAAAVVSVAAPPLTYGPYLMQEPLAYPVSTFGLWAIAAYVAVPTRLRFGVALAVAVLASQVRGELTVLLGVLGVGLAYHVWRTGRFRAWRRAWSAADWVGFVVLGIGAVLVASAVAGHVSEQWYLATGTLKQKLFDHGVWALAATALGMAMLPLVAGLAVLVSPEIRTTVRGRAFAVTGLAAVAAFVWYAALKGAVVSTVLGALVVERNLIYAVPVLVAATAAALAYGAFRPWALAAAGALAFFVLTQANFHLDKYPYFEAPSLAIGALANRNWSMDDAAVREALYLVLAAAIVVLAARLLLRRRAHVIALGTAVLLGVLTWSLTTEIYAARGLNHFSQRLYDATPKPVDWVDEATGGEPSIYLGQLERDPNQVWLLEFWNRTIERVWSMDGSAPPPTLTPDLAAADGTLTPDPGVEWVVARGGVAVDGEPVGESRGGLTLYRLDGPLRIRFAQIGVEPDGWMGAHASFSRYVPDEGLEHGLAQVVLSRQGACGDVFPTSTATVRVGALAVVDGQPTFAGEPRERQVRLEPCAIQTVLIPATVPYHIDVEVDPTFVPREVDASSGDARSLGAQVGFGFDPL